MPNHSDVAATRMLRSTGSRTWAWAVLATAVLQVVSPVVTINGPGSSPGDGAGPELLITPVGWAFSIWGVIYALAAAQAVGVLVAGSDGVPRRLQVAQLVLYLGASAWIVLAGLDSSVATAAALLVMFAAAVVALLETARGPLEPRWLAVLTVGAVGLYAGWVTAAVFLNLSTALVDTGVLDARTLSWQLTVLVLAVLVLLALTVAARGNLAYAAAGVWAMLGIGVTGNANGTGAIVLVTVVSAIALLAVAATVRRSGRPAHVAAG